MSHFIRTFSIGNRMLVIILIMFIRNIYGEEAQSRQDLLEQKRRIEFNMVKLRVKLIKENDELRRLNESIIKQQKQLMKKLDAQSEMRFLLNRLGKINKQLK